MYSGYETEWEWPGESDADEWRRLTFTSEGSELAGAYGPASGDPKAAILLVHPRLELAKGYFVKYGVASALRRAGYDVFCFDLNGFGESEHGAASFHRDVVNALRELDDRSTSSRFGALAASFGAGFLLAAVGASRYDVEAVAFDCTFPHVIPYMWRRGPKQGLVTLAMTAVAPRTMRTYSPAVHASSVADAERLLFVHGGRDAGIPERAREKLIDSFPQSADAVERWVVPGARHLMPVVSEREEYHERVRAHFDAVFGR